MKQTSFFSIESCMLNSKQRIAQATDWPNTSLKTSKRALDPQHIGRGSIGRKPREYKCSLMKIDVLLTPKTSCNLEECETTRKRNLEDRERTIISMIKYSNSNNHKKSNNSKIRHFASTSSDTGLFLGY